MSDRRKFARMFFFSLALGLFNFVVIFGRPSFEAIRTIDVVHLICTGMLFGIALIGLIFFLRSRPSK